MNHVDLITTVDPEMSMRLYNLLNKKVITSIMVWNLKIM